MLKSDAAMERAEQMQIRQQEYEERRAAEDRLHAERRALQDAAQAQRQHRESLLITIIGMLVSAAVAYWAGGR